MAFESHLEDDDQKDPHKQDQCEALQVRGIPWTPLEFVQQAAQAGHPVQLQANLPLRLRNVTASFGKIFSCLTDCICASKKVRHWSARARELRLNETQPCTLMLPRFLKEDIAVWKEMLESIRYEDMRSVDEFIAGSMQSCW